MSFGGVYPHLYWQHLRHSPKARRESVSEACRLPSRGGSQVECKPSRDTKCFWKRPKYWKIIGKQACDFWKTREKGTEHFHAPAEKDSSRKHFIPISLSGEAEAGVGFTGQRHPAEPPWLLAARPGLVRIFRGCLGTTAGAGALKEAEASTSVLSSAPGCPVPTAFRPRLVSLSHNGL